MSPLRSRRCFPVVLVTTPARRRRRVVCRSSAGSRRRVRFPGSCPRPSLWSGPRFCPWAAAGEAGRGRPVRPCWRRPVLVLSCGVVFRRSAGPAGGLPASGAGSLRLSPFWRCPFRCCLFCPPAGRASRGRPRPAAAPRPASHVAGDLRPPGPAGALRTRSDGVGNRRRPVRRNPSAGLSRQGGYRAVTSAEKCGDSMRRQRGGSRYGMAVGSREAARTAPFRRCRGGSGAAARRAAGTGISAGNRSGAGISARSRCARPPLRVSRRRSPWPGRPGSPRRRRPPRRSRRS